MTTVLPDGPLHLLCVAAHPDDVELACGATLLQLARRPNLTAAYLTLTGTAERVAEARAAAEAFLPGSSCTFADLEDGYLPERWGDVKRALHRFAGEHPEPDVVLVPWSGDAHQDHRTVGTLAPTVWRSALLLHYEVPKWDGDLGRPSTYVPVDEPDARRKWDLLDASYPSQRARDWWDPEMVLGLMRVRGMECKSRFAEAFHVSKMRLTLTPDVGVKSP